MHLGVGVFEGYIVELYVFWYVWRVNDVICTYMACFDGSHVNTHIEVSLCLWQSFSNLVCLGLFMFPCLINREMF